MLNPILAPNKKKSFHFNVFNAGKKSMLESDSTEEGW